MASSSLHPKFQVSSQTSARAVPPSRLSALGAGLAVLESRPDAHPALLTANTSVWSFPTAPAEDFFSEMWSPGLLDRLQVPLSRYHE
jgi:hypothetical protein